MECASASAEALSAARPGCLAARALVERARNSERPAQLGALKSTMLQLDPAFTERDFGVSTFSGLMEKLQEQKLIKIKTVDHHLVVERLSSPAGETIEPSASSADREEALPALQGDPDRLRRPARDGNSRA
ncbi:MAG: OST-HTH/LOTUS domain-containing protein [Bryobacterales bacterium]